MSIPVYSFIAFSNTGKTTFLEKLVPELKKHGLKVAVYKHDGHDFEIDKEGKDSYRMTQAGADVTLISSRSKAVIMENRYVDPEVLINRITDVDIIITEGYKAGPWKKIAMRRAENGQDFPIDIDDCFALISDTPVSGFDNVFDINDVQGIARLLISDINAKITK